MGEIAGVLAAVSSSALGGTAVGATRYLAGAVDPTTLGALRFGVGFVILLPITLVIRQAWPKGRDLRGVAGLGVLFFCLFPILFNAALAYTTAARGALALSTLPLLTMLTGAALGAEALSLRKSAGVVIAVGGVAVALLSGLSHAPPAAWIGDLLMVGAAFCMALYNVWSRPFIARSGPLAFTTLAMGMGALCLGLIAAGLGGFAAVAAFTAPQWLAVAYLGLFCGALVFFLWALALSRTTPTRVAISVTVNPITAALFGATLLDEPIGWTVVAGLATVTGGIWLATTSGRRGRLPAHTSCA